MCAAVPISAQIGWWTYPINSLDIFGDVLLGNLAESLNVRAQSHKRAHHGVGEVWTETEGTRNTQRKIHRGVTGLQ